MSAGTEKTYLLPLTQQVVLVRETVTIEPGQTIHTSYRDDDDRTIGRRDVAREIPFTVAALAISGLSIGVLTWIPDLKQTGVVLCLVQSILILLAVPCSYASMWCRVKQYTRASKAASVLYYVLYVASLGVCIAASVLLLQLSMDPLMWAIVSPLLIFHSLTCCSVACCYFTGFELWTQVFR